MVVMQVHGRHAGDGRHAVHDPHAVHGRHTGDGCHAVRDPHAVHGRHAGDGRHAVYDLMLVMVLLVTVPV